MPSRSLSPLGHSALCLGSYGLLQTTMSSSLALWLMGGRRWKFVAEEEDQGLLPLVPSLMAHSLQQVAFSNLVHSS